MGRPLKFKTPAILKKKVEKYFEDCDKRTIPYITKDGKTINIPDPRPYTITGLAIALDTDRDTLLEYEKNNPKLSAYSDTIRKAKQKCQNFAEESLWRPKIATGVIFNLVNNYGWKNKQEHDHTTGGEKIQGFNYIVPSEANDQTDTQAA